jgi:branched-chain amino acid transport system substrate-binding protein
MKKLFAVAAVCTFGVPGAFAQVETHGVTKTFIKIGGTFPFSGPASSLGNTGKGLIGYINMLNERGGVNNRKIDYIALDDA